MEMYQRSLTDKPYDVCVSCVHIGVRCDGPNFYAMDVPRLAEWCRSRKDFLHSLDKKWTNAYVADEAKLSKATVDRFFAGLMIDLKVSTVQSILRVLVNGTWGQYPCAWAATDTDIDLQLALGECERTQKELKEKEAKHRRELDHLLDRLRKSDELIAQLMEMIKR